MVARGMRREDWGVRSPVSGEVGRPVSRNRCHDDVRACKEEDRVHGLCWGLLGRGVSKEHLGTGRERRGHAGWAWGHGEQGDPDSEEACLPWSSAWWGDPSFPGDGAMPAAVGEGLASVEGMGLFALDLVGFLMSHTKQTKSWIMFICCMMARWGNPSL